VRAFVRRLRKGPVARLLSRRGAENRDHAGVGIKDRIGAVRKCTSNEGRPSECRLAFPKAARVFLIDFGQTVKPFRRRPAQFSGVGALSGNRAASRQWIPNRLSEVVQPDEPVEKPNRV